jgi:hypothetical protein
MLGEDDWNALIESRILASDCSFNDLSLEKFRNLSFKLIDTLDIVNGYSKRTKVG